jgi:type I restriction enzyme S subunit
MRSETTLSEVCSLIVDCSHKTAPEADVAHAYAAGTKAVSDGRIAFTRARQVDAATYATWTERVAPRAGDIILCREAPVGPAAMVPDARAACLGQEDRVAPPRSRSR